MNTLINSPSYKPSFNINIMLMKAYKVEETEDTPFILLDAEKGIFEISGRSLPEDASAYYYPVLNWLDEYSKNPNPKTDFSFKLVYFNTASSKLIYDVLLKLEKISNTRVVWYHFAEDEDMIESGEELSERIAVPFVFKVY